MFEGIRPVTRSGKEDAVVLVGSSSLLSMLSSLLPFTFQCSSSLMSSPFSAKSVFYVYFVFFKQSVF